MRGVVKNYLLRDMKTILFFRTSGKIIQKFVIVFSEFCHIVNIGAMVCGKYHSVVAFPAEVRGQ